MAFVNLSKMPAAKAEQSISYEKLSGGLNLWELDYRLKHSESPEMKNLMWRDGALNCRDGQIRLTQEQRGRGWAMAERAFHGRLIAHVGKALVAFRAGEHEAETAELYEGLQESPGSFFLYDEDLYYKNRGAYIKISYQAEKDALSAQPVKPYTPVTVLNASPATGSGDLYQPENRLSGAKTVCYNAEKDATEYRLPAQGLDGVSLVKVNGGVLTEGEDYFTDLAAGVVSFVAAPTVSNPPENNTVEITYIKEDAEARKSIMDCPYAVTYGGTGALCLVFGGSTAQPNAYFWNGNHIAMDAGYFPVNQYQLAGDYNDPITGFARQQSYLIVFKERSLGRTSLSTQTLDGRLTIDLPYVPINNKIGCDLPRTICLVENNVLWCGSEQGVYVLKDSSAAYENNVMCVSRKVNGTAAKPGLLQDVRADGDSCCGWNDGHRYALAANGNVWVWDYELSSFSDPSWFYWTNIPGRAYAVEGDQTYHLDAEGRLSRFARVYADYGQPIEKVYRFATEHFGGYDRLKNVNSVVLVMRSDTNAGAELSYITDFEKRPDGETLHAYSWLLAPRNLSFRSLAGRGFASVFRRKPDCRQIRHFTMRLKNDSLGEDLSIVSAQIFYNYQGRQK